MQDKYQRVTQAQLDLWLIDPVTQAYLLCLSELTRKAKESLMNGSLIDSTNNDLSMNSVHSAIGMVTGYENASRLTDLLNLCEMIEHDQK